MIALAFSLKSRSILSKFRFQCVRTFAYGSTGKYCELSSETLQHGSIIHRSYEFAPPLVIQSSWGKVNIQDDFKIVSLQLIKFFSPPSRDDGRFRMRFAWRRLLAEPLMTSKINRHNGNELFRSNYPQRPVPPVHSNGRVKALSRQSLEILD